MSYLVDRARAFSEDEVVAILAIRRRGARSRLLLADGSLVETLTRSSTFQRKLRAGWHGLKGVRWQKNG